MLASNELISERLIVLIIVNFKVLELFQVEFRVTFELCESLGFGVRDGNVYVLAADALQLHRFPQDASLPFVYCYARLVRFTFYLHHFRKVVGLIYSKLKFIIFRLI